MVDKAKLEKAVRMILEAVGEEPGREGLRQTPARVARGCALETIPRSEEAGLPEGGGCPMQAAISRKPAAYRARRFFL